MKGHKYMTATKSKISANKFQTPQNEWNDLRQIKKNQVLEISMEYTRKYNI